MLDGDGRRVDLLNWRAQRPTGRDGTPGSSVGIITQTGSDLDNTFNSNQEQAEQGPAIVRKVLPGSPAHRCGLVSGDVVVQVNGQHANEGNLFSLLHGAGGNQEIFGSTAILKVERGYLHNMKTFDVEIARTSQVALRRCKELLDVLNLSLGGEKTEGDGASVHDQAVARDLQIIRRKVTELEWDRQVDEQNVAAHLQKLQGRVIRHVNRSVNALNEGGLEAQRQLPLLPDIVNQRDSLREQVLSFEGELADRESQINTLSQECDSLREKILSLEHELADRESKMHILSQECDEAKERACELELQIYHANARSEESDLVVDALREEMKHLSERARQDHVDLLTAATGQMAMQETINSLQENLQTVKLAKGTELMDQNVMTEPLSRVQEAVRITMKLGLSFDTYGDEGSFQRSNFELSLSEALGAATDVPAETFVVRKISSNSIVEIDILPLESGETPSPAVVAASLQKQSKDMSSHLCRASLTRHVEEISEAIPSTADSHQLVLKRLEQQKTKNQLLQHQVRAEMSAHNIHAENSNMHAAEVSHSKTYMHCCGMSVWECENRERAACAYKVLYAQM